MAKFRWGWGFFSLCRGSIYSMNEVFYLPCNSQSSDGIKGNSLSQQHCSLSFPFLPLSAQAVYSVCKLFEARTWLLSAGKAAGTWLVLYKQTIIMLSRSRCLEPVLRWKRLRLIWWNTNNVLHAITSIWMLDSLIKRGLREFIAHYVSLASQVDVFHTNDYGYQSWSH